MSTESSRIRGGILALLLVAACAQSIDDAGDGLDPAGAGGGSTSGSTSGADASTTHPHDGGSGGTGGSAGHDASTLPPDDGAVVADTSVADTSQPPVDAPTAGVACPSSGTQYALEYLAALALAGDGGPQLSACPCSATECCYTPPGGIPSPACLPL